MIELLVVMILSGLLGNVIIILFIMLMEFIFNPILIAVYALFYRKNLLYKQRFALLFYKFRMINLIIYIIDTLVIVFMIINDSFILKEEMKISIILSCIIIPLYIFLYVKSKNLIEKNKLIDLND